MKERRGEAEGSHDHLARNPVQVHGQIDQDKSQKRVEDEVLVEAQGEVLNNFMCF